MLSVFPWRQALPKKVARIAQICFILTEKWRTQSIPLDTA
jgi:hypothetical protein